MILLRSACQIWRGSWNPVLPPNHDRLCCLYTWTWRSVQLADCIGLSYMPNCESHNCLHYSAWSRVESVQIGCLYSWGAYFRMDAYIREELVRTEMGAYMYIQEMLIITILRYCTLVIASHCKCRMYNVSGVWRQN